MSVAIQAPPVAWPLPTVFEPRPYQLEGLRRIVDQMYQVLDHGLGAGKTTTALAALEMTSAMRVLVLCPQKVLAVWRDELEENSARQWIVWAGKVIGAHGRALKDPSVARRCESIIQANKDAIRVGRPFLAAVNYEALTSKAMQQLLLGTAWDVIICDESHRLAGAGGKWSKFIAKITKLCRARGGRIIEATGTFLPHSGLSCFGQMRALNPDVLGWSWAAFKARYAQWRVLRERNMCPACRRSFDRPAGTGCPVLCVDTATGRICELVKGEPIYHLTPGGEKIPDGVNPEHEAELMQRIAPWVHRVSQAELDAQTGLVETPPQIRTCTLRPATRKVYDALEKDLIAQTADGMITAANAMVNVLRLAQVTSGYGVDAEGKHHIALSPGLSEKASLLADELEDLPVREPVVIFARFHHDLDQIRAVCEKQGRRYAEISGRRSDGLIRISRTDHRTGRTAHDQPGHRMADDCDVVGVQPQAGGAGISLTRAALCIFYSSDWSLANYDQAKRRVLRQGQTRHVVYLHLVAEDTVDVSLFYALKKRRETNDAVLARLKGAS